MAFSAAFGYYLKWDSDRKDRLEQQIQAANERKAEQIQAVINQKMEWMRRANIAVMNLRELHEDIIAKCIYHKQRNQYAEYIARTNERMNVGKTYDRIRFIFNNINQEKFADFTNFDESITDVCAKEAPSDDRWRQYQYDLNNLMGQSIQQDKDDLMKLNKHHVT